MYIEQLYTGCLAEAAYYIESNGEAAIIDPLRETEPYITLAEKRGAKIKYVLETHFHADFVSGHIDLAREAGAEIIYGPGAQPQYKAKVAKDGEVFSLGRLKIKVLHTPGHTPESSCYLLFDEHGREYAVFTGDTLFVGDVGRPDLAIKSDLTKEDLAGMLYDSLHEKLLVLPDDVIMYPAHGAGSACGKNIGKERYSTLGEQKKLNYALRHSSKEAFIEAITEGLASPPAYFMMDAKINQEGYRAIDEVLKENTKLLGVNEFKAEISSGEVTILDTRHPDLFEKGFIPGAVNIGLDGQYAVWVGSLLDPSKPLLLVTEEGREREAVLRLARVGYENVKGILKGGINAWKQAGKEVETIASEEPEKFVEELSASVNVLDVRNKGEWENGVIDGAQLISLGELKNELYRLDKKNHYYVHCAGGYRSMIASSILKKHGYNVTNVRGGMGKIKPLGIKLISPLAAAVK